jgi:hypothetical protein
MKHRWIGGALLALAFAACACAPTQGSQPTPDARSAAPPSQAAAPTAVPAQTDDGGAPPDNGSYDY